MLFRSGSAGVLRGNKLVCVKETTDSVGSYELVSGSVRRHTVVAETPLSILKINQSVIDNLISANASYINLFNFLAGAEISSELLRDVKPYSDYSVKKMRTVVKSGQIIKLSNDDKQRLAGSRCILVKGKAIADDSEISVSSPAVLDDCNVRGSGEALLFLLP